MGYAERSANKASNMAIDKKAAKGWMTYMNLSRLNQDQSRNPDLEGEESQDLTSSVEDIDIDPPTAADTPNENDEDVVSPQNSGLKFPLKGSLILLFSILLIFFDKKKEKKSSASSDCEKPKIGPNKVSDFLLFWIIPYLLNYTHRKVREIKEHHRKRERPEFRPVCRKSTLDIIEDAMLSCGVSGELKATIMGKYKDFYGTDQLEYEYELLQSLEGAPIILVPRAYKVTQMPLKLKDIGTKWRELGDTNLLTVFLSKFIRSRKIQRDFFDSLDFMKYRQAIDYAIILPDEKTFVELEDAFERESHDYSITPEAGRNRIVPRLGLVTTTEKYLRVCFTYFRGSKREEVAAMFRAIGTHFLDHFTLIILHGLSLKKSDPMCNIGSLYPVGIARKVTFTGNSVQVEKRKKKSDSKNTGKKDFSAGQGKFCRAEFPITYDLWQTETRKIEVVKNLISRAEASLGFNPNFERDILLHVAYTTKSHQKKLKEESFGASMTPNEVALSRYQIRAVNLDGTFLGNVVKSGRKENIAVVLAIKDVCGRVGCGLANLPQAIQSIIVNFVRAVVVAGLPKVYPSEPDEEDRDTIEIGSSSEESKSSDDEPCDNEQNVAGKGEKTPTATETESSGYSSLSSEKLTLLKNEKTELLTGKYSEFKDNPWLNYKGMQKSIIYRGLITEHGGKWNLPVAAAYVTFPERAVPKPLFFTCSVWPHTARHPPIGSDELLVSNVIELSHDGKLDLEFSGGNITVSLMHSASDLKGYEVVIKQLVDPNRDEWKDLETRCLLDMSEAEKPEVSDCLQLVEASCLLTQCSTFAAIWRLKTFSFSRHTAVAPQLTCVVPDFPDVCVEVPLTSVPIQQDFTLTLKVQEYPSGEVAEKGVLVGPVLHISSSQNIELFEPVTIKVPLTLRGSEQHFSKVANKVVRLFYLGSEEKPKSWTDITDQLEGQIFLKDGIVEFKVKHFSRFWLFCMLQNPFSLLTYAIRQLCLTQMPQRVHFLTCLCETTCNAKYQLLLFCFPNFKRADVVQEISRYETPFVGEGKSKEPLCKGDKIVVSLTALIFEHESQKNEEIILEFRGNDICDNSHMALIVSVDRDSVPVVEFRTCKEISKVVCRVTFSKPRSTFAVSSPMGVALVEERPHFSVNFEDSVPIDDVLEELGHKIGNKWQQLGRRLGFEDDMELAQIEQAPGLELSQKAFRMLKEWKQKKGSNATYKVLYEALSHKFVGRADLAEDYCTEKK